MHIKIYEKIKLDLHKQYETVYEPYTLLCYFIETLPIDNNDNDVLYLCRLLSLE